MPEYPSEIQISNLPEVQKVEITNFPKQKTPVVNISPAEAPVVNVEAPIVNINQGEVVSELEKITAILSKEEAETIEQTQIIDNKRDSRV